MVDNKAKISLRSCFSYEGLTHFDTIASRLKCTFFSFTFPDDTIMFFCLFFFVVVVFVRVFCGFLRECVCVCVDTQFVRKNNRS